LGKDVRFEGLYNIQLHLGDKTSQKWLGIGILQPNQQSNKIAIYWSLMKILASNFTDKLSTGNIISEMQN